MRGCAASPRLCILRRSKAQGGPSMSCATLSSAKVSPSRQSAAVATRQRSRLPDVEMAGTLLFSVLFHCFALHALRCKSQKYGSCWGSR